MTARRDPTVDRLRRVLERRLRPAVHSERVPLEVTAWHAPGEPVPFAVARDAEYQPCPPGTPWGPPWGTSWLRCVGTVPASWFSQAAETAAQAVVEAVVDLGFTGVGPGFTAEGMAYTPAGRAIKGVHPLSRGVPVRAEPGARVEFLVEAAANPTIHQPYPWDPTELGDVLTAGSRPLYTFGGADLALVDPTVRELVADLEVLDGLLGALPEAEPRRWEILSAVRETLDYLDRAELTSAWSADAARSPLAGVLARPATATSHRITAVGHAHIDTAWLWPLREARRKVVRTVANALALAEEYPELVFAFPQAQQHQWLREDDPELFERLRAAVAAGTVLPVGGMWVESDANLPGGEAMVRQLVYGKRFFREVYGVETPEVWLPDSFGYSAALPQVFRLAGMTRFLSQKLSWNQTNAFPHHTFWWEGLDGSRVLAHFPPVDTYNSDLSVRDLSRARDQAGEATRSLVPFGWGDGGGGPTREMLAQSERVRDLEGLPTVRLGSPGEFFDEIEPLAREAPCWSGELYLEGHRGTYTTQARVKRDNRRCEHLLREAELWCATAAARGVLGYPYDTLDRLWRRVLLHQFHDILPGASIAWVYREAAEAHAEIARELEEVIGAALRALAGTGDQVVTFNAAPYPDAGVPAMGGGVARVGPVALGVRLPDGGTLLDNGLVELRADPRGAVVSVRDLVADRELTVPGEPLNTLRIHADHPVGADAWDLDEHYRDASVDLVQAESLELGRTEDGDPCLVVRRRLGDLVATQRTWLAPGARRVDFAVDLDWPSGERLCKAVFPLDLRAESSAAEVQFGYTRRPVHRNTSWETAKFEVYGHRFVHVGEPDYGAALVNDATYGFDAGRVTRPDGGTTTTVGLSLVRSPRFPDPRADQGRHRFRYALVVGAQLADAVREGYRINLPTRRVTGAGEVPPLVSVSGGQAVVECVKLADDQSGDLVVRLYEPLGNRVVVRVTGPTRTTHATTTDLLERPIHPVPVHDGSVDLSLRPHEIQTLRLTL